MDGFLGEGFLETVLDFGVLKLSSKFILAWPSLLVSGRVKILIYIPVLHVIHVEE
jgi:hypothetical protein